LTSVVRPVGLQQSHAIDALRLAVLWIIKSHSFHSLDSLGVVSLVQEETSQHNPSLRMLIHVKRLLHCLDRFINFVFAHELLAYLG